MKQIIEDAFLAGLAGIVKYRSRGEIIWEDVVGVEITIEFPTNSPYYAIVRQYYENGNKANEVEYQDGG